MFGRSFIRRHGPWLLAIAALAGFARFYGLGDGVLREDELNRYLEGRSPVGLVQFWKEWSAPDQIPFQNVFCMFFARTVFSEVNEFSLRAPGAVLGVLTVLLLAAWIGRHWGRSAGIFAGVWLALNPFHLLESREAYYYGMVMFHAAVFSILSLEMGLRMRRTGTAPSRQAMVGWTLVATLLCASHMSTWIYAFVFAMAMLVAGIRLAGRERIRVLVRLGISGIVILALMHRWVLNAIQCVIRVRSGEETGVFLGGRFSDVAPWVLPVYLGGVNPVGFGLLLALAAAGVWVWRARGSMLQDRRYPTLTTLALLSVAVVYAYIGGVGSGVAKIAFFAVFWPVFTVWTVATFAEAVHAARQRWRSRRWPGLVLPAAAALIGLVLLQPAWMIMNLDGKVTPYHQIRDALDQTLPAGSLVMTDHWFEPWIQLAIYAPSNVTVTFTVPDEPYPNYAAMDWRGTTRRAFESGLFDAFMRRSRKYEDQIGPWDWPDSFFARKVSVTNPHALWLRKKGYWVMATLFRKTTRGMQMDLLYNTDEDWIAQARRMGRETFFRFGTGWRHTKPWRMQPGWPEALLQSVWIQAGYREQNGMNLASADHVARLPRETAIAALNRGRWADYRMATDTSRLRLFNLEDAPLQASLEVTAVALGAPVSCRAGSTAVVFPPGLLTTRSVPVTLQPGRNNLSVTVRPGQTLLVREIQLKSQPDSNNI